MSTDAASLAACRELLRAHSDHPSAFLMLNQATSRFSIPGVQGFIAYRPHGGFLFQMGGVVAVTAECRSELLAQFLQMARTRHQRVCVVQLRETDVDLYRRAGFSMNQMGVSYVLDVRSFSTSGSRFANLRNKVGQARRSGVSVHELGCDLPRSPQAWSELEEITQQWLLTKGRNAQLIEFMIGELGRSTDLERRVFVARQNDRVVGFTSFVPVYGPQAGFLHDLTRRRPDAPAGVMDLITLTAIERFRSEGIANLHFGLSPFAGLTAQRDCLEGRSPTLSWISAAIARHGERVYPSKSQEQYKLKWRPSLLGPEYIGFEGGFSLAGLWRLLQLTRTV